MKRIITLAAATLGLSLAACNSTNGTPPQPFPSSPASSTPSSPASSTPSSPASSPASPQSVVYNQIERLSRPVVKEVFEPFNDHKASNAAEPYNDATLQKDIPATEDFLRAPNTAAGTTGSDYGKTLAKVLYPDEYLVNLNGSPPSGADPYYFLSSEVTKGAAFGGRAPNDDVINLELGILFGGTLPALGLAPEDNEENTCLSTQNLAPKVLTNNTFPYLIAPH